MTRAWVMGLVLTLGCSSSPMVESDASVVGDGQVGVPVVLRPGRYTGTSVCEVDGERVNEWTEGRGRRGVANVVVDAEGIVRFSCPSESCSATAITENGSTRLSLGYCERRQGVNNVNVRYTPFVGAVTSEGGRIVIRAGWSLSAELPSGAVAGTAVVTETLNPDPS